MSTIHRDSCDLTIVVIFLVYSLYVSTICFAELSVMLLLASGSSKVFGGVSGIHIHRLSFFVISNSTECDSGRIIARMSDIDILFGFSPLSSARRRALPLIIVQDRSVHIYTQERVFYLRLTFFQTKIVDWTIVWQSRAMPVSRQFDMLSGTWSWCAVSMSMWTFSVSLRVAFVLSFDCFVRPRLVFIGLTHSFWPFAEISMLLVAGPCAKFSLQLVGRSSTLGCVLRLRLAWDAGLGLLVRLLDGVYNTSDTLPHRRMPCSAMRFSGTLSNMTGGSIFFNICDCMFNICDWLFNISDWLFRILDCVHRVSMRDVIYNRWSYDSYARELWETKSLLWRGTIFHQANQRFPWWKAVSCRTWDIVR